MSRRRFSDTHTLHGGTRHTNKEKGISPFSGLAVLRNSIPKTRSPAPTTPPSQPSQPASTHATDNTLFRQTVQDVRPLKADGRAEIDRPRPPPLPRKIDTHSSRETESPAPEQTDPLSIAYAGVTPLRATGRVNLLPQHRYAQATQNPYSKNTEDTPLILPSETTPSDPAALFEYAMRGTQPLNHANRVELPTTPPPPHPLQHEADERAALDESLHAPLTFEDRLIIGEEAVFLRSGLPKRVISDLRRGRWVLQGEIDLHGFTREQARDALARFLTFSLQQGRRCIRVIHGKGLGSPGRFSILKHLSRNWLAQREEILAFCQAGPNDGGEGALMVLLRAPNAPHRSRSSPT